MVDTFGQSYYKDYHFADESSLPRLSACENFRTKERTLSQGIYDSNQYSCVYNAHVLLETGNTSFIESDQKGDLAVLMSFQDRPKS